MTSLLVFIDDKIKDERVRISVAVNRPVKDVIAWYVAHYKLPTRDFDLSQIEYYLVRAVDDTRLSDSTTLQAANIAEGELLELVSPEGRRVWRVIQKLLDEIESQIKDKFTGKIKDKITEEVWDWVTKKLDEIEKTHTGGQRVEQVREWVDQIGGPTKLIDIAEEVAEVVEPYQRQAASSGIGSSVGGAVKTGLVILTIGGGFAVLLVGGIILYTILFSPSPTPTRQPAATIPVTEQEAQPPTESVPSPEEGDMDEDGLTDNYEEEIGTDPNNPDSDGDGLWDGSEVLEINTDPLNPDTDEDGYWDGEELEMGSDPLDPDDPGSEDAQEGESLFNRGMVLFDQGAFEEAIDLFNQAQESGWENAELFYYRAWACQQLEFDFAECSPGGAISDYSLAIKFDPEFAWAYINRGILYYTEFENNDQGLQDLDMAVALAPDDPNTYFHRGVFFLRQENWDALIQDMTQAIELDPEWPDLFGHRGFGYQQIGLGDEARADYKIFLALTEGNPDYQEWREPIQNWLETNP